MYKMVQFCYNKDWWFTCYGCHIALENCPMINKITNDGLKHRQANKRHCVEIDIMRNNNVPDKYRHELTLIGAHCICNVRAGDGR